MKDIVSLCKRRGFIFQASEIYGGVNGFWDYGPLGVELKNNIRDLWWKTMVITPPIGPDGKPLQIVGLDTAIIQNPQLWKASGHIDGFSDPMLDCRETKLRYREDKLIALKPKDSQGHGFVFHEDAEQPDIESRLKKLAKGKSFIDFETVPLPNIDYSEYSNLVGPDTKTAGTLTEPKEFNLMLHTYLGAASGLENKAYLRPETCGSIFTNFKNVVDTSRVRIPFGIAQIGKSFRNEVTPRNFIFRSREFEQMEMQFFCDPKDDIKNWFDFWKETRKKWWLNIGLSENKLHFHAHSEEDLAHYAKNGVGAFDIEYQYPFIAPNFDELEGIHDRSQFDLTQHESLSGKKMQYQDLQTNEWFTPYVLETAAGLTRGVLAILCEAYTVDETRPSGMYMNFHPSVAPKKAAILPLVAKDGQPEVAQKLYMSMREHMNVDLDIKQNIGKRYARQDEIGTPFCVTIDPKTLEDQTVTIRERNTMAQERIHLDKVLEYIQQKIAS